ncbi:MAG: carbamate kinase [Acidimicrobiia bacterium]|nr:carbamate kinase [Acidimicrobiia bacterium]NNF68822.1 carbamate kinase [Acidimicrobiia bacterium]NNK90858.1 carbamate kinase [Acidimicrobiia bacterium]
MPDRPLVLAFGGNALLPDPDDPSGAEQRAEEFAAALLMVIPDHSGLVLVHGNGPQVGTILLRVEATRDQIPADPLDVLVAETQGSIGYLLARALRNALRARNRHVEVATVATQVVVEADDGGFSKPTKPIGPFYDSSRRVELEAQGWDVVEVANRGLRRVVASPHPRRVVELHTIGDAARHGHVVIAGGGGGIPVVEDANGDLVGVEAVIDKDRTAALLARSLHSAGLVILTAVPAAYLHYGTPQEQVINEVTVSEARELLDAGEFPPGSMGPKIEALADYAEAIGRPGLVTSVPGLAGALKGETGTWVVPDDQADARYSSAASTSST